MTAKQFLESEGLEPNEHGNFIYSFKGTYVNLDVLLDDYLIEKMFEREEKEE